MPQELIQSIPNGLGTIDVYHDTMSDFLVVKERTGSMTIIRDFDMKDVSDVLHFASYMAGIAAEFSTMLKNAIGE